MSIIETKSENIPIKDLRCPKCNKQKTVHTIIEIWSADSLEYDLVEDKLYGKCRKDEGYSSMTSQPIGLEAKCRCGHKWKIREVTSISDLDLTKKKS